MSNLENVLKTKEAKEAVGEGLVRLIETGDLDRGIEAMFERGTKNGSWPVAQLAIILDFLGFSSEPKQ